MKSTLILSLALIGFVVVQAQPEISHEWTPKIGDSWTQRVLLEIPDVTETGADHVWDYSDINTNAIIFSLGWNWVDPASTPYVDSFPEATLAATFGFGGFISYGYYGDTGETFDYWGSGTDFGTNVYLDPQTLKYIDLQYGETVVDTYVTVFNTTFSQPDTVMGFTSFEYDGYGTIKIGDLEVEDAVRIYQQDIVYDSTGSMFFSDVYIDSTTTYAWIAEGTVFPIVQWQRTTTISRTYLNGELLTENIEEPDTVFAYDPDYFGSSSIRQIASLPELDLYPTIATDEINLSTRTNGSADYSIFTLDGKVHSSGILMSGQSTINVAGHANGWYVLQVDGYQPRRFLVQH